MDPFLGEIRMFAGNFAPQGWALCDGQILPIQQYTALFSLLGTNYGGDGVRVFALPNLQGMSPLCYGNGPGLSPYVIGQTGGASAVTLLTTELPAHSHNVNISTLSAPSRSPSNNLPAYGDHELYSSQNPTVSLSPKSVTSTGGNQSHNNLQPSLVVTFIIALEGVFPARQ